MISILSRFKVYSGTIFIPLVLILLGYISFTHVKNEVSWDLLRYMTYALNMFNGQGYVDMDGSLVFFRGPVFPLMIAASYKLFGISALSALGVVKLFCVMNPVLIYYFGRKLFSERIGFAASLCLLTSYSISFWSFQFIDPIWPFFIILYSLFLYLGFEQEKRAYFVLAGIFLGLAFLVKEVAVLFFPLSLLMFLWIKEYRNKNNFKGLSIGLIATIVVLLPWIMYLHQHEALSFLLGTGGPVVLEDIGSTFQTSGGWQSYGFFLNLLATLKEYGSAFIYFYSGQTNTVTANFTIAPLFLAAWLFVFVQALRGNRGCKIIILQVFLFLPIIYFIGKNHWRFGQVLFIMLISYAALVYSVSSLIDWICKRLTLSSYVNQVLFISFVFMLIAVQVFGYSGKEAGYAEFFQRTTIHQLIKGEKTKRVVSGAFLTPYLEKTIEKLTQVTKRNEVLLTDSFWAARKIFFQLEGKRNIFAVPMIWCRNNKVIFGYLPENRGERALYLHSNNLPLEPQYRLYVLFESQLINLLHTEQIKHVILSPLFRPLEEYFSASDNYEKVFSSGPPDENDETYHLFRVKDEVARENDIPFLYSDQLVLTLNTLRENDPLRYQSIRDVSLYKIASLSEEDVGTIVDSLLEIPSYYKEVGDQFIDAGDILQAITAYEEVVRLDPKHKRYLRLLARLYHGEGMTEKEIRIYKRINQLDPDNPMNFRVLGDLYRNTENYEDALAMYSAAISLNPEQASYYLLAGIVFRELGDIEAAIEQYQKARTLQPKNAKLARILGDLYRQIGEYEDALAMYKSALSLQPDMAYYHSLVSLVYVDMGELDKALRYAEEAVRLNPTKLAYKNLLLKLNKKINRVR